MSERKRKRGKRGGKKHRKAPRHATSVTSVTAVTAVAPDDVQPLPIATVTPRLLSALTKANQNNQRFAHA